MPTIQEVAKHTGVGAITISQVVNHVGYISQHTRYLTSLGHRRITVFSGHEGVFTTDDRVLGYCRALKEAPITSLPLG